MQDEINSLITQIYAAALDREQMPEMFSNLAKFFKASAGAFTLHQINGAAEALLAYNHSPATSALYDAHYAALDAPAKFCAKNPGLIGGSERWFVENPETYNVEYEEDFAKKFNHFYRLAVGVSIDDRLTGVVAFHRDSREGDFPNIDYLENTLKVLYPHLCQAFRIDARFRQSAAIIQALAKSKTPAQHQVILYDVNADIIFADDSIKEWLGNQFSVRWCEDRLFFSDTKYSKQFNDLLAACAMAGLGLSLFKGGSFEVISANGEEVLLVEVSPGYSRGLSTMAAVTVTLTRSRREVSINALRQRFGLTVAEASVAMALVAGKSVTAYAEEKGISIATVRSQVRAIFEKTGVSRMSGLVRLLS